MAGPFDVGTQPFVTPGTPFPGGGSITPGQTPISGGTNGRLLFDNAGVVGEALLAYSPGQLQLGDVDGAAPVAQTVLAQSVAAGQTNANAPNTTIGAAKGTGTGLSGTLFLQTAPSGSSGTTQNALVNLVAVGPNGSPISGQAFGGAYSFGLLGTQAQLWWVHGQNGSNTGKQWTLYLTTTSTAPIAFATDSGGQVPAGLYFPVAIGFASAGVNSVPNIFITPAAAATLQFGQADAAAPVAQTLQVQSTVAGTSNTAGALFTIVASKGTGTGVGGDILFQATAPGSSGTSQNPVFNILRITPTGGAGASLKMTDPNTGTFSIVLNSNNVGLGSAGVLQVTIVGNSATLGFGLAADQLFGWSNVNAGANPISGMDTMLGRAAAANIRLGQTDAAAPIAQTLSVQSVVAGTSNVAGVAWTFVGSKSTGNAGGGSIIFQVTPAGGSGTSQNAVQTTVTMLSTGIVQLNGATVNAGLAVLNNVLYLLGGGATAASGGSNYIRSSDSNPLIFGTSNTDRIQIPSGGGGMILGAADAAAPIAQTLSVQNVVAGTSNTAGAGFTIVGSKSTGNAAGGAITFQGSLPGSSGTTQNAAVTLLTITPVNTVNSPILSLFGDTTTGWYRNASSQWTWGTGGANTLSLLANTIRFAADLHFSASDSTAAADLFLHRAAAAVLQLGQADAAAPIAQTLLVQSVVAGTSNTSGPNFTIAGSKSTGTGIGGNILFQVTPLGTAGSSQNAYVTALTIGAATAYVQPAAGTTVFAPLQYTSGTNLTTAQAGAREYDGVQHYATIDTTSGRAGLAAEQYFHLTANGGTISTIANFFGSTSNISLVANAHYIIEIELWFGVNTGALTVTWTLTNSAAPTNMNVDFMMCPVAGLQSPPGSAGAMLEGQSNAVVTAAYSFSTSSLTTVGAYYSRFRIWLINGSGTSLKIQATASANSITPLTGSWWRCRRMSPNNIGTFAA